MKRLLLLMFVFCAALLAQPQPQPSGPVYIVTHIDVFGPNAVPTTNKLLLDYAAASRKEKGAKRIEVVVQDGHPNHYTVIEVWDTRAQFEEHNGRDYAKQYREKLQPFLGSPFDERWHSILQ